MNPNQPSPAELVFVLAFYGVIIAVALGVSLLICYLLYNSAKSLPQNFQQASPGQAFLLMIPLFSLVWLFIYLPKLSQSFQAFFRAHRQQTDDCGEQVGLWWAILSACSIIPCVGIFTGLASLVLMIIYLVKVNECKNRVNAIVGQRGVATPGGYSAKPPSQGSQSDNPYEPPR